MQLQLVVAVLLGSALASSASADPAAVARGGRVYAENCSTCHGEEMQNNSTIAFDLRKLKADEHERFISSVTNGKNNVMPSWDGALSPEQIEDVWAYVRANANE